MSKYTITIEETVVEEFEIEAKNINEAFKIAKTKYYNGEIILSPGEVQFKQMAITTPCGQSTEWIEF